MKWILVLGCWLPLAVPAAAQITEAFLSEDSEQHETPDVSSEYPEQQSQSSPQSGAPPPAWTELSEANWHPLGTREKYRLFSRHLIEWETHASLMAGAAISFGAGFRSYLGDGARGYFRLYGFNVADRANRRLFQAFLLPTVFHEDPRYVPLDRGSIGERTEYALTRIFIARTDSGDSSWNKSKLLGSLVSESLSNVYYDPAGRKTEVGDTLRRVGIHLGTETALNLLREFWPDIAAKINLNAQLGNMIRKMLRSRVEAE